MRAIFFSLLIAFAPACPASSQETAPPEPAPLALDRSGAQLPAAAPAAAKEQAETPRPLKAPGAVTHREMAAERPESETSQQAEAERESGQNLMKKAAPE